MYLVPFLRYSASKNGVNLKGVGVVHVIENGAVRWLSIGRPLHRFRVIWRWIMVTLKPGL